MNHNEIPDWMIDASKDVPAATEAVVLANQASGQELIGWVVFWGIGEMRPIWRLHFTKADADLHALEMKSVTEVRPVYTHSLPAEHPLSDVKEKK